MAKRRPTALDALSRHDEERRLLESRRAALEQAAALELGLIVLAAGGARLGPEGLRMAICAAVEDQRKNETRPTAGEIVSPVVRHHGGRRTDHE